MLYVWGCADWPEDCQFGTDQTEVKKPRGRYSWCWPKESRPLETRSTSQHPATDVTHFCCRKWNQFSRHFRAFLNGIFVPLSHCLSYLRSQDTKNERPGTWGEGGYYESKRFLCIRVDRKTLCSDLGLKIHNFCFSCCLAKIHRETTIGIWSNCCQPSCLPLCRYPGLHFSVLFGSSIYLDRKAKSKFFTQISCTIGWVSIWYNTAAKVKPELALKGECI